MQQLARDSVGNVFEIDAQGNPIRLVTQSPLAAPSNVVAPSATRVADKAREEARQSANDARIATNDARSAANEERRLRLAEDAAARAAAKGGSGTTGGVDSAKARADAMTGYSSAGAIRRLVKDLQAKFDAGPGSTSGALGVQDYLPTETNRDFDAAGNSLRGFVGNALGFTGGQLNSVAEAEAAIGPYLPKAGDYDEVIRGKIERLENLANDAEQRSISMLGGRPDANGRITPVDGAAAQRTDDQPLGSQIQDQLEANRTAQDVAERGSKFEPTTGTTGMIADPRMASRIDSLINAGASKATIDSVLTNHNKQHGTNYPPISAGQLKAAQDYIKQTGKQFYGSEVIDRKPLNFFQRLSGSAPAAAVAHGANAATAGLVGLAAGEKGRGALDAMAIANPKEALGGNIVGGVLGAGAFGLGATNVAARLGTNALRAAPVAGDVAYGAMTGFNGAEEGEGGMGALTGAGAGLLGSLGGQVAARTVGAGLRGVRDPAVELLRARGVPLTVGQASGNSGRFGAGVRNVENALTSVPGVSGVVNARYREGLEGFNEAAFRELPGHSGQTGSGGIVDAGDLVDGAYSFLDSTTLPVDAPFAGSQAAVRADLPTLPGYGREVGAGMDAIDASASRMGGALPGREWQSAVRNTRADRSSIAGQPFARPAMGALDEVEANLMGLAQRQGPAGTIDQLNDANVLNGQYQTLLRALDNGPAQQADELFTPARLDAASRQGANAFGGRAASIGGDRPFYDLTTAGRSVLPSTVPDSGTATRGLVAGGVLGAGGLAAGGGAGAIGGDAQTGAGYGLGTALLLAAGGSRVGQRALTSVLLDRPDLAIDVGEALSRNAHRLGWTGTSVLTPLAVGPQN